MRNEKLNIYNHVEIFYLFFVQVFFVSPLKVETKVINDSIVKITSMHQFLKDKFFRFYKQCLFSPCY